MSAGRLRLLYFAGPVDALSVHRNWAAGTDDDDHVAVIYLRQFLDVQAELGAEARVFSARPERGAVRDDVNRVALSYRPVPWRGDGPLRFVVGRILAGLRIVALALWHRADVVVVTEAHTFWFLLVPLRWCRIRVVATLHCALWPVHRRPGVLRRLLDRVDLFFFRRADAVLVVSDEIAEQVRQVAASSPAIHRFVPSYPPDAFSGVTAPDPGRRPFEVLYAGRIAAEKGVFLLLDAAEQLARRGRTDIRIHLCGDGPALEELRRRAREAGLGDRFACHGFCQRDELRAMYGRCHAVVVPTTTEFVEGFNKVVLEAVLAGRPVVTSSACPALSDVAPAVLEVLPDDADQYRAAIERLCDERVLYGELSRRAREVAASFGADRRSFASQLRRALVGWPERDADEESRPPRIKR